MDPFVKLIENDDFVYISDNFDSEIRYKSGITADLRFTGFGSMDPIIIPADDTIVITKSNSMPNFFRPVTFQDAASPVALLPNARSTFGLPDNSNRPSSISKQTPSQTISPHSQQKNTLTVEVDATDDDQADLEKFFEDCGNITFNPRKIGFAPTAKWTDQDMKLVDAVKSFFQVSGPSTKFAYKLFNALRLSESSPDFIPLVGVAFFSDEVLRINVVKFDRLLGIKNGENYLFGPQGLLSRMGFQEISTNKLSEFVSNVDLYGVDINNTKFFFHTSHFLTRKINADDLEKLHFTKF